MTRERRNATFEIRYLLPRQRFGFVVIIALLGGCGTKVVEIEAETVHPVRGKVMFKGKPAVNAYVRFFPEDGVSAGRMPSARTQKDGTFIVTTFAKHDGAPPGRYVVTIVLRDKEADGETTNLLPERYSSPDSSDLRVDIRPGDNILPPFMLRS